MVLKKKILLLPLSFALLRGCDSRNRFCLASGFFFYGESISIEKEVKLSDISGDSKGIEIAKITNEKIDFDDDGQQYVAYATVKITPSVTDFVLKKEQVLFWIDPPKTSSCVVEDSSCLPKNRPKESDDKKNIAVNGYNIFEVKLNKEIDYTLCFIYPYTEYSMDDFKINDRYSSALEVKIGYKNYSFYFVPLTREEHAKQYCK